ncbi:hypothetical protein ACHWQZ_G007726 [Mnemiopsis leidyi]
MRFRDHTLGNDCVFTVPERYTNLNPVGSGAHGTVCSADDSITHQKVAIKKLLTPFESNSSAHRVYRELSLMKHCHHPNIIRIFDVFIPEGNQETMTNIYIVMEYMEHSLRDVIQQYELTCEQISSLTYQLACGLKFLQSLGIMHRDLKPANVGVNKDLTVKILDFGLARADSVTSTPRLTYYIVTRYYRAPEVILGLQYDEKVDIWSLGCILGEMLFRDVLFMGDDEIDQWHKITKKLGTPPPAMLLRCSKRVREFIEQKAQRPSSGKIDLFQKVRELGPSDPNSKCNYDRAADCLAKMLTIDPTSRTDVATILEHPFLQLYRWTDFEQMPDQATLDAARDNLRLYDTSTMGVREWREKVFHLITTTWQSSLGWETQPDGAVSPRQAPQPLNSSDQYAVTFASNLTLFSPLLGYMGYKIVQRYFPENTHRQHALCGGIIFLSSLIVSRILK